jgi:hypothetical protein
MRSIRMGTETMNYQTRIVRATHGRAGFIEGSE